jgi:hypothetical protein
VEHPRLFKILAKRTLVSADHQCGAASGDFDRRPAVITGADHGTGVM